VLLATWHPDELELPRTRSIPLIDGQPTNEQRIGGGLLEFRSREEITLRVIWRPEASDDASSARELPATAEPLRAFAAPSSLPLNYSITHVEQQPTPLRVSLRRRIAPPAASAAFNTVLKAASRRVAMVWLDNTGTPLHREVLTTREQCSQYDLVTGESPSTRLTEPATFHYALPPAVAQLRFVAEDDSVLIVVCTRPDELQRTQRLPDEGTQSGRLESAARTWFPLQPDNAMVHRRHHQSLVMKVQARPPDRDPAILAGHYEWESFQPRSFWQGRYFLTRRESSGPLREEASNTTYCEWPIRHAERLTVRPPRGAAELRPRLIYVADHLAAQPIRLILDERAWFSFRPRALQGELVLPELSSAIADSGHSLQIVAEPGIRIFLRSLLTERPRLYLKRFGLLFSEGQLQFEVDKHSAETERLLVRVYFPNGLDRPLSLRARLLNVHRVSSGPFSDWTLTSRQFEIEPQPASRSPVLDDEAATIDSGQRCLLRLGDDLPPGPYTLHLSLPGDAPRDVYAIVSRLTPAPPESRPWREVSIHEPH
jgi:hypothetical protein